MQTRSASAPILREKSLEAVRLDKVGMRYGRVVALESISFSVQEGEFFSLLGPSGSGKTTTLRLIAGFDRPSSGKVYLFGQDATRLPPYRRAVNTVFQDYALFPHMNVRDNVAYPLLIRKVPRTERYRKAEEMLALVKLEGFGDRRISQLSGGQKQRVALARALILKPRVLLLDEPLGALDLKLRQEMQVELKRLQQLLGITFIYVTHDQGEALSMSDRVAVFSRGRIEQIAPPKELYYRPRTQFVAEFVGGANVLVVGGKRFALRPERIRVVRPSEGILGRVEATSFVGYGNQVEVRLGDGTLIRVLMAGDSVFTPGDEVGLAWDADALWPLEE
ncbi:ABC transporter ATP-binding protein [Thermus sp. PS18]|uniref:ABC transporter ATP-binding protein n=1 Tax=Thermus sp. PS18 TaxID=2849039 RepID=UPI00226456A1|nr:ABC transporter ATP-binding protein [Thermus sp. PS18]UZX14859.1 ABC transporter ATP-binding protein [Thermus sp. PS18]